MLFYLSICLLILIESSLGNVTCGETYSNSSTGVILAIANILWTGQHQKQECSFFIEAPANHIIVLNFTSLVGFWKRQHVTSISQSGSVVKDNPKNAPPSSSVPSSSSSGLSSSSSSSYSHFRSSCSSKPRIEILGFVLPKGTERRLSRICRMHVLPTDVPLVFHSESNLIKVTYTWRRDRHNSQFTLEFHFRKKMDTCNFRCNDGACLPSTALVCNSELDCSDGSDEDLCGPDLTPATSTSGDRNNSSSIQAKNNLLQVEGNSMVHIVAIVLVVVVIVAILICLFSYIHRTRIFNGDRRDPGSSSEHNQLHPASSITNIRSSSHHAVTSEVEYVPDERLERQLQSNHQHHLLLKSAEKAMDLALPPAIPRSEDGEEGYIQGQKSLFRSCDPNLEISRESVRPPPNKCVEEHTPPPYRSNSLEKFSDKGVHVGNHHRKCARIIRDRLGNTVQMPRCNSLSIHNKNTNSISSQQRHCITYPLEQSGGYNSGGHASNVNMAPHRQNTTCTSSLLNVHSVTPSSSPRFNNHITLPLHPSNNQHNNGTVRDSPPSYREVVRDPTSIYRSRPNHV